MLDGHDYLVADVFTDTPLQGNPVAVFLDAGDLDDETMQRAARELHLSETVFVVEGEGEGEGEAAARADARIRIFTPGTELPFAGHPVLGTACVLARAGGRETIRLATGAGIVPVDLRRVDGRPVGGEMFQPIPTWEPFESPGRLLAALGIDRAVLPIEVYDNGPRHVCVAVDSTAMIAGLAPDLTALAALGPVGISCFCAAGDRVHTRMFAPGLGVAEDPATGSAAGPLAVHLARHGAVAFGARLTVAQGAEIGRPSRLHARVEGDADRVTEVAVGGDVVIVAEGSYRLGQRPAVRL